MENYICDTNFRQNIRQCLGEICRCVYPDDLLKIQCFSEEERSKIEGLAQTDEISAAKKALNIILMRDDYRIYVELVDVLKATDYPKLVSMLCGEHVPDTGRFERTLCLQWGLHEQLADLDAVMGHLKATGVLNQEDRERINTILNNKGNIAACSQLFKMLHRRHAEWPMHFERALEQTGNVDILQELSQVQDTHLSRWYKPFNGYNPAFPKTDNSRIGMQPAAACEEIVNANISTERVHHSNDQRINGGEQLTRPQEETTIWESTDQVSAPGEASVDQDQVDANVRDDVIEGSEATGHTRDEELGAFLENLSLEHLGTLFEQHGITYQRLLLMNESELLDICNNRNDCLLIIKETERLNLEKRRNSKNKNESSISDTKTSLLSECIVCMDKPRECVFCYCGHLTTCMECAQKSTFCPTCRDFIQHKMKVYM